MGTILLPPSLLESLPPHLLVVADPPRTGYPKGEIVEGNEDNNVAAAFVLVGDLGIVRSDGTEVPQDKEQSPGGYVPVNNENNDYTFDASGNPIPDYKKAGPVVGEHDLVPLKLHSVDPIAQGGQYRLVFSSANIKIWSSADKTGPVVADDTEFDATQDTTVYVEGISRSVAAAQEEVALKWINGDKVAFTDRVAFTVYEVTGPMEVPDYSIHTYRADVPGGGTGTWTIANGTDVSGVSSNSELILWSSGPAIGKATFSPAPGFSVDYEVSIVQVKIEAPSVGNAFIAGTPTFRALENFAVLGPVVSSGSPGIRWKAKVTMTGPSEYGVDQRGVTHIEVGFVQNVTFTTARGDYMVDGNPLSLTANLQGQSYHDADPGDVYYDNGASGVFKPTGTDPDARVRDALGFTDEPTAGVPLYYLQGNAPNPPGDATLSSMHWLGSFTLWITARTDDTVGGADATYTARAIASWSFTVNEAYPMANPLAYSSVTVPAGWTDVKDGREPTLRSRTDTTANQAESSITYH
jgi:hypothetical protein